MKRKLLLLICLAFSIKMQAQLNVSYSVQAHQDDWQLFMSSQVIVDIAAGGKMVFITLTAGDEGNGTGNYVSSVPFFLTRERGSVYSSKYAADINGGIVSDTPSLARVTLNGHSIVKYVYNNNKIVNYFLRLPDGDVHGAGFPITGNKSLYKFKNGLITSMTSVDGLTTYTSWTDLTNTIKAIMMAEKGLDNQVWVHTASLDSTIVNNLQNNSGDHSDHYYSSKAVEDAIKDSLWVGINWFMDYRSSYLAANLSFNNHQNAAALYALCAWGLTESRYQPSFNDLHKSYLAMDYFTVRRAPVGSAAGSRNNRGGDETQVAGSPSLTSPKGNTGLLTEIPMLVALNSPVVSTQEIKLLISPYEPGNLITTIFDKDGNTIYSTENRVPDRQPLIITLKNKIKVPGTYTVNNILNGKYVENRKIDVQ